MERAAIRRGVFVALLLLSPAVAVADENHDLQLAAAHRIVGPHGLTYEESQDTRRVVNPLHWAAITDDAEAVAKLVEGGVPVDLRDSEGRTALMVAAAFGNAAVAETLIAHGADPRAADGPHGNQPLHYAAVAGRTGVAEVLLAHDVAIDARGPQEETPLHYAALYGQRKMISWLFAHGADTDAADDNGVRPLQYAYRRRQDAAAELLVSLGARSDNLHDAVNAGDTARVQYFLAHGSDVDERDGHGPRRCTSRRRRARSPSR